MYSLFVRMCCVTGNAQFSTGTSSGPPMKTRTGLPVASAAPDSRTSSASVSAVTSRDRFIFSPVLWACYVSPGDRSPRVKRWPRRGVRRPFDRRPGSYLLDRHVVVQRVRGVGGVVVIVIDERERVRVRRNEGRGL